MSQGSSLSGQVAAVTGETVVASGGMAMVCADP